MASISRYVLVDREDHEQDWEYADYDEAVEEAEKRGHAVIEREYEYADSGLAWTPHDLEDWPPPQIRRFAELCAICNADDENDLNIWLESAYDITVLPDEGGIAVTGTDCETTRLTYPFTILDILDVNKPARHD